MEGREVKLLCWLENSGNLSHLRDQCHQYRAAMKPQAVFKLSLDIDPLELLQYNAELGNMLLHCPRLFWGIAQRLCYEMCHCLEWLPSLSSSSQLLLELRLTSLPSLPGYMISCPSDLPPLTAEPQFYTISGVIIAASIITQYTQSACFKCTNDDCNSRGNSHYVRLHVAGSSEANIVSNNVNCQYCGLSLNEDIVMRTLANKMIVYMAPLHSLCNTHRSLMDTPTHHRHQATPIIIRGDLCDGVSVGRVYSVIGVPVHSLSEMTSRAFVNTRLEANNIFHIEKKMLSATDDDVMKYLPNTITDILKACSYSPWVFSATLAYSFAAELTPPGTYHRLKLALLLSLASCNTQSLLHLLVVAMDTTPLHSLLVYASSMTSRSTQFTSNSDLWGTTRREGSDVIVEGGGLLLATGGVCVVGNIKTLKKDKLHHLQQTLESSQIKLSLPQSLEEGRGHGGQMISWNLSCNVWGYSSHGGRGERHRGVTAAGNIHDSSTTILTKSLADNMGVVIFCDPTTTDDEEYVSEMMTQHILDRATGIPSSPPISHTHLHQLLSTISYIDVILSRECQQLLQLFYIASRRVRTSSGRHGGSDMPVNALKIMRGLAESHAKLNMRSVAIEEDGVMAILIYEESLTSRYGHSILHLIPTPHFRDNNLSAYIGKEFDQQMRSLHKQILQFIKCYSTGLSSVIMPEE